MNAVLKRKIGPPINDVNATGIHYTIVPKDLAGHLFFVTLHIAKPYNCLVSRPAKTIFVLLHLV